MVRKPGCAAGAHPRTRVPALPQPGRATSAAGRSVGHLRHSRAPRDRDATRRRSRWRSHAAVLHPEGRIGTRPQDPAGRRARADATTVAVSGFCERHFERNARFRDQCRFVATRCDLPQHDVARRGVRGLHLHHRPQEVPMGAVHVPRLNRYGNGPRRAVNGAGHHFQCRLLAAAAARARARRRRRTGRSRATSPSRRPSDPSRPRRRPRRGRGRPARTPAADRLRRWRATPSAASFITVAVRPAQRRHVRDVDVLQERRASSPPA